MHCQTLFYILFQIISLTTFTFAFVFPFSFHSHKYNKELIPNLKLSSNWLPKTKSVPDSKMSSRTLSINDVNDIHGEDPYLYLEDVESEESLNFAKMANNKCLEVLGDPKTSSTKTYEEVLAVLESDDRIPYVRKYGTNDEGDDILFNIWKDGKVREVNII